MLTLDYPDCLVSIHHNTNESPLTLDNSTGRKTVMERLKASDLPWQVLSKIGMTLSLVKRGRLRRKLKKKKKSRTPQN